MQLQFLVLWFLPSLTLLKYWVLINPFSWLPPLRAYKIDVNKGDLMLPENSLLSKVCLFL